GVRELLLLLQESGLSMALATSSQKEKVREAFTDAHINLEMFETVITGDDVEHPKPSPDIYLKVLTDLGRGPHECLVIEDSLHGIEAAKAADIPCIAVHNTFSEEQLIEAGADMVVQSLELLSVRDLEMF
ncbi:MAG: HAD family hydrolase, partial [Nanoarchaeota archaeon]